MSQRKDQSQTRLPTHITVLVTAHPDDESMFFLPTLRCLQLKDTLSPVWIICLTTGNFDGIGTTRAKELRYAAEKVIGFNKVILLDDTRFQDDPTARWNVKDIVSVIQQSLANKVRDDPSLPACLSSLCLITFDADGVSGHVNHCDAFRAVQRLVQEHHNFPNDRKVPSLDVEAWSLKTIQNPIRKYLPLWEWFRLLLCWLGIQNTVSSSYPSDKVQIHRVMQPTLNWRAMVAHKSQFVWYRRLFVVFSCYTYVNRLRLVEIETTARLQSSKDN